MIGERLHPPSGLAFGVQDELLAGLGAANSPADGTEFLGIVRAGGGNAGKLNDRPVLGGRFVCRLAASKQSAGHEHDESESCEADAATGSGSPVGFRFA